MRKMKKILVILVLVLAVSVVFASQLNIRDFKEIPIYYNQKICDSWGFYVNGSNRCNSYSDEEVYHHTDYIKDGVIRVDNGIIEIDGFFCLFKGDKRIECISKSDGFHKEQPEKNYCNPHGGMTCIIIEIKDDKTYYTTYIDGKKYDKEKIKWDKLKWI